MTKQEMVDKINKMITHTEPYHYSRKEGLLEIKKYLLEEEPNPIQDIVRLNEERYGLDFNPGKAWDKLKEELDEFLLDGMNNGNKLAMLDALADIIVIATGEIRKMGYNPELALNEVVKEISSRKQDKVQAYNWMMGRKQHGEKWQKQQDQDPNTLYKADFEKAKIKGE